MKYTFIFLILSLPQISIASLSDCGEYEVRGVVRAQEKGYGIVVNEKTMSEINISLPLSEQLKILPYSDKPMKAVLLLDQKFDGTKGESNKIISITFRIPDPLKPGDTGMSLMKKTECSKK